MQWRHQGGTLLLAGALLALAAAQAPGAPYVSGAPHVPGTPHAPAAPHVSGALTGPAAVRPAAESAGRPAGESARVPAPGPARRPAMGLAASSAEGPGEAPAEGPDPLDFAVVVDQSRSLADQDLARETEAAALLSQGEISERSRATVIGFGSSEKPGQSPVREVCPPTVADAAGRERLSDCVQGLNRRDAARMGPGTDFPAAIRQAVSRLTGGGAAKPSGTPKVVFLLTDGKLDVSDSPEYGTDPANRQSNGERRLTEELARARAARVQIWPLGFGGEIDRAALTAMAAGGYRGACNDVPGSVPHMRVVGTSAEIDAALQETFAAARCARIAHGTVGKPPADLNVVIPPIATDGSLTVSKHDPKVRVTYYDPAGRPVPTRGEFDGSTFEVSGQDGPVEALRVKNPMPGRWRVRVEAPEGHRDREVAVRAIWQGRLRSDVTLDPASPRAGEKVTVEARMQTRRGVVITDPAQLAGLAVVAELRGDGFAPVALRLADDGRAPDRRAGDVRFTGTLTLPAAATGALTLTTRMSAPGVTSDRRPLYAETGEGPPPVTAGLVIDRATVHPGDAVHGTLDVTNDDSRPHTLRLTLRDQPPGAGLTLTPSTVTAPPGTSTRVPFTVTVGSGTPLGEPGGTITVVDTGDGDAVLDTGFLDVRVVAPPTWWERWWKAVVGGVVAVLLLAAFAGVRMAARRRRRDLTGVTLELRQDGRTLDTLTVRRGQSPGGSFAFAVDEAYGAPSTLRRVRGGATSTAHVLRRTGTGELLLRPRGGAQTPVRPGEPTGLGEHELVVRGGSTGSASGASPSRTSPRTSPRASSRTSSGTSSGAAASGRRGPLGSRTSSTTRTVRRPWWHLRSGRPGRPGGPGAAPDGDSRDSRYGSDPFGSDPFGSGAGSGSRFGAAGADGGPAGSGGGGGSGGGRGSGGDTPYDDTF